jgi:predicted tellurium resistance membrane protein TerC
LAEIFTSENLIALLTLTLLEIVLGIDNIVFISILTGKLPQEERGRARRIGLSLAMVMRIGLLFALSWVMRLTKPLFSVMDGQYSGRDLIMLGGGLFLIAKATYEIHDKLEGAAHHDPARPRKVSFANVITQILVLDVVFSLDSVITAVGMAQSIYVMVLAVVLAVGVMLVFAGSVSDFVERHPTIKMLALSFLILIGVMLVAEGMGKHVPRGYVYFAMAFSLLVELLNMRLRRVSSPVHLHQTYVAEPAAAEGTVREPGRR